ncbi:cyclic AMP-responsive element-binding 3 1 [Solea senegalensis]|uniref:Cyclic AMP-responsive element-binding 3 1 n=1 Tax=Solea senegalensis TaxID=28829 RepID=A0AAV6RBZ3_SOLSE|nr:cyclic AMP-responsive element-binding protein 3-like protein 1 isoform X1 [Solea senegalensis]KAG7502949.1 cyclic AMP-responsive element-binding 3 1 [Solea senegalensis]
MMESILDSLTADKLYPSAGANLLDLEELSDGDFLTNVPFSGDQMDDFNSELFSSFFDDHLLERPPLLADRPSLLHMDIDSSPDIQAEHSYSLSEDSAPQSPALSIKMDQESEFEWSFNQDLSAILVKQEEPDVGQRLDPQPLEGPPLILNPAPPHRGSTWKHTEHSQDEVKPVAIKDEPRESGQYLSVPSDDALQLPPTPPSSNHGDSDGSLPPSSPHLPLPPSSPQPQQRPGGRASSSSSSSSAISSSPLLTAPHKLQGSGPLMLTEEEKRTLVAEGYPVPNKLPLTKSEEKALKRVRRKIKNKISAQESRRKKKEYVECLEKKVESYTSENSDLWRKVENLETANRSLLQQLQKLQSLISGKVVSRSSKMASTQTGTCLMMMAVCFVLVLGSFSPCLSSLSFLTQTSSAVSSSSSSSSSPPLPSADLYTTSAVRSRSLLFYNEGSPLEESLATEGERPQSEAHIQMSRYTADAHRNHTTKPELDRRETKPDGASDFF